MIAFLLGVAQALGAAAEEKEIALQHAAEADAQLQQLKHAPEWLGKLKEDLKNGTMLLTRASQSGFTWPRSGRLPLSNGRS